MLSRCVQGLRVQEMTNGFIEPIEGRQAPADCCSTLSSTPEKLAHRTNSRFLSHVGALHASSSQTERNRGGWLVRCASYSVFKSMLLCFGCCTSADLYCFESPVPEHSELPSCSSDLVTFPSLLTFWGFALLVFCISNDPPVHQRPSASILFSRADTRS